MPYYYKSPVSRVFKGDLRAKRVDIRKQKFKNYIRNVKIWTIIVYTFFTVLEKIPLQNARQSSTFLWGNAIRAIDGNLNTYSATLSTKHRYSWWEVELERSARIDHIMIRTTDFAFRKGWFQRYNLLGYSYVQLRGRSFLILGRGWSKKGDSEKMEFWGALKILSPIPWFG